MPKIDIIFDGTPIGAVAFEIENVQAQGGPDFPQLRIRLDLSLYAFNNVTLGKGICPLTWLFLAGEFCSPGARVVSEFRHEVGLYAYDINRASTTQLAL